MIAGGTREPCEGGTMRGMTTTRPDRERTPRPLSVGPLHAGDELRAVARRLIWWMEPDEVIGDASPLVAQALVLGTWADVEAVRSAFGDDVLADVLAEPPPGVFDWRSWSYWHHRLGALPAPPFPVRYA